MIARTITRPGTMNKLKLWGQRKFHYRIFCKTAPDAFLANAQSILGCGEYPAYEFSEQLSKDVWETFKRNKQESKTFTDKMNCWKSLNNLIQKEFPQNGLFAAGSTLTGFGLKNSDMDMSLLSDNTVATTKGKALYNLSLLYKFCKKQENIDGTQLIQAIVPVLKLHEKNYDITVDINYNHLVNIYNTHLLLCYSQADWRVRPLAIVVKLWAKNQGINNAQHGTISSYSLILMVIHYLQCGAEPALFPSLQNLFVEKFKSNKEVAQINFFERLKIPKSKLHESNTQTLGELLVGFFRYYDTFDFNNQAISVRLGTTIPRSAYLKEYMNAKDYESWKCMYIEEPFNRSNVSRSVYDPVIFQRIRIVIGLAYRKLSTTKDLHSIFRTT